MNFAELGVPSSLVKILEQQGITTPTPIQAATLPDSLAGRDVLGRGRTGSGKTYGFLLPLVARLDASKLPAMPRKPRALILAPTRELVGQIHASLLPLAKASGLSTVVVYGGVGQGPQTTALKKGVDIVIACPGRLEDLMGQGYADLSAVEVTILDEADHMADLGFLPGVRRIMDKTPRTGQRMLFSATLDKAIDVLVKRYLTNPATHEADSAQSPVSTMSHHVLHVSRDQRVPVLVDLTSAPGRTVVFTRTKHGAKALARQLNKSGVPSVDLHGNLSQNARTRNMEMFHSGKATTLVATDIAARGIHVDDVALVIHADPPTEHKAYLHRSGRTARAGAEGTVITLMTDEQQRDVRDLTRQAGIKPTTTKITGPGHAMLEQLAPGVRSTPGGLVVEVPTSTGGRGGGGGRSTGANAQRKRARATGETGGRSRRGNPTSYTSETPGSSAGGSTGGGQRRRSGGGQGAGAGQGAGGGQGGGGNRRRRSGGGQGQGGASTGGSRAHSASSFSRGR
ncbi:RNA helicase [Nocardioides sp. S5]|uniref:DEAD/DEAH box helicase n=1 Tax=Nocardioides sp. S5 TaxID=2017486 RepID=UPI001A909D9A|nr:DEAD/DEAH box helicase [Nocardioides sp. S5]QSR33185.1 RNA helicase [Nocardioides sp. S5]